MVGRRGTWVLLVAALAVLLCACAAGMAYADAGAPAAGVRQTAAPSDVAGWTDVDAETLAPYGVSIQRLARVSQGYADGRWNPGWPLERGQFTKMAAAGLINGVEPDTFEPFATITRQQGAAIIARYLAPALGFDLATDYGAQRSRSILQGFADADQVGAGLLSAVAFAVDFRIIEGSGGHLRPNEALTRIQGAAVITRALRDPGEPPVPARSMGALMDEMGGPDALGTVGGGAEDWPGGRALVFWKGDAAQALAEGVETGALPVDVFLPAYVRATDAGIPLGLPETSTRGDAIHGIDYLYQTFGREDGQRCDLLTFTGGPREGATELVWSGTFTAPKDQPFVKDILQLELSRDSRVTTLLPDPAVVTNATALQVRYLYQGRDLLTVAPLEPPPDSAGLSLSEEQTDAAFLLGFAKGSYAAFRDYASAQPGNPARDVTEACVASAWDLLRDATAWLGTPLASIHPADVAAVDAWRGTAAADLMDALARQMEMQGAPPGDVSAAGDTPPTEKAGYVAGETFTATVALASAEAPYGTVSEAAAAARTADARAFDLLNQSLALADQLAADRATPRPWVTLLRAVSVDEFVLGGLYNKWPTSPSFVPDGQVTHAWTRSSLGNLESRPLVRFYTKGTGYAKGKWWGLLADVKGLSAEQVEDTLALPTAPTHYVLGEIKPDAELAVGPAAAWPVDSGYPMTRRSHGVDVVTQERIGGGEQIMILSDPGPTFDWDQYIEFETDGSGMLVEHAVNELLVP